MGNTLWIKAANADEDTVSDDLTFLYKDARKLDKICKKAAVKKLSEFHDNSDMAAEFGHDMPPLESDPYEIIESLEALQRVISSGDSRLSKDHDLELLEELEYALRVAVECRDQQTKVRLIVLS